jgi:proteasome alpha subunit
MAQQYTQYAGARPFGVALILAGVDKNGIGLYLTDPSGTYIGYDAVAIGAGSEQVTEHLEKNYRNDIGLDNACILAIESIFMVSEEKTGTKHIRLAVIDSKSQTLRMMPLEEIENYSKQVQNKESQS